MGGTNSHRIVVTKQSKSVNSKTGKVKDFYRFRGTARGRRIDLLVAGPYEPRLATKLQSVLDELQATSEFGTPVQQNVEDAVQPWIGTKFQKVFEKTNWVDIFNVPTIREVLDSVLEVQEERADRGQIVHGTVRKHRNAFDFLCAVEIDDKDTGALTIGEVLINNLSTVHVQRWAEKHRERYSDTKRQYDLKVIRRAIDTFVGEMGCEENPFKSIKVAVNKSKAVAKRVFVPPAILAVVESYLKENKNDSWYVYWVLLRWTGARRNEPLHLKWSDIDFDQERIEMPSPKTAAGGNGTVSRLMPMFEGSPLKEMLRCEWNRQGGSGDGFVVRGVCGLDDYNRDSVNWDRVNPSTTLTKLVMLSGVKPWVKLCQNIRVTRENELLISDNYRAEAIHSFIGHTRKVFERNYFQVSDEDFKPRDSVSKGEILTTGEGVLYSPVYAPVESRKSGEKSEDFSVDLAENAPTSTITQPENAYYFTY